MSSEEAVRFLVRRSCVWGFCSRAYCCLPLWDLCCGGLEGLGGWVLCTRESASEHGLVGGWKR
jgi:hypothetical protein